MQAFKDMLSEKTKVVALVYVSNMLGSILDTDYVAEETHKVRKTFNSDHFRSFKTLHFLCLFEFLAIMPGMLMVNAGRGETLIRLLASGAQHANRCAKSGCRLDSGNRSQVLRSNWDWIPLGQVTFASPYKCLTHHTVESFIV